MTVELSHLGEPLVAAMLVAVAAKGELPQLRCAATGTSIADDLGDGPVEFISNRAALRVQAVDRTYSCDGAQTVDVLAAGVAKAVAFELKLGLARMSINAFQERFCGPCGISAHRDPRLTGSMVAVLDAVLPFTGGQITAFDSQRTWALADHWWLVVRQSVWDSWRNQLPVRSARILVFDSLATLYGTPDEFDVLVHNTVGSGFADRWQIRFGR